MLFFDGNFPNSGRLVELPVPPDCGIPQVGGKGMGRWRVGLIGAGWVSQYHLRAWRRQAPRAEVVAIADPDASALSARAAEFGIASMYENAETLVAEAEPDVMDICAPREVHADLVRLAASRGLAVICQKPLARDLAEADG